MQEFMMGLLFGVSNRLLVDGVYKKNCVIKQRTNRIDMIFENAGVSIFPDVMVVFDNEKKQIYESKLNYRSSCQCELSEFIYNNLLLIEKHL
jgi:hypothetical protein